MARFFAAVRNARILLQFYRKRGGGFVEIFVLVGGPVGKTGTLASSETCACGYILPAGSYETDYEQ